MDASTDASTDTPDPLDGTERLVCELGDALRERDAMIAAAESCTGGLIGATLTGVPGSSEYFDCSVVAYAYDAKRRLLGVSREALDAHGAVSEPVARQMAAGARDTADTTWGVSVTGIAGPEGGSAEKPVGTVYVGVAYAAPWGSGESYVRTERYEFGGNRRAVRTQTVKQALADVLDAVDDT